MGVKRIALAVWGDPVVGRALVLLLQGSGYEAKFLPLSSLDESEALDGVRLLLLTPVAELGTEPREALLSFRDRPRTAEIPVLELVRHSEETREGRARDGSWHVVPWPCSIEELERWIEAVLLPDPVWIRSLAEKHESRE